MNVKRVLKHPQSARKFRGYDADIARTACVFPWRILHVFPGLGRNRPPRILSRFDTDGLGARVTLGVRRGGAKSIAASKNPEEVSELSKSDN